MASVIELCGLGKAFGGVRAVEGVDLAIAKSEIVALLGPSGCGKTTTLRMMAGFETPTEGRILLHGEDIVSRPARERNMGMVFQNYALFPHMTVAENIAFGLKMRKEPKGVVSREVERYLALVKLEGFGERKPSQLSGGQQQRVALARALITRPNVLLMDEPFGALDKKLRETMQLEIRNILKSVGITAVLVTHDQEEALVLADRVVVMNQGRIEQIAPPKEIYEKPETLFVANFIGVSNVFSGTLTEKNGTRVLRTDAGHVLYLDGEYREYRTAENRNFFVVRPEKISVMRREDAPPPGSFTSRRYCRFSTAADGTPPERGEINCIPGRIANIKYLGTVTQYYVNVNGDKPLIMDRHNVGLHDSWKTGDECLLRVDPSHCTPVFETVDDKRRMEACTTH